MSSGRRSLQEVVNGLAAEGLLRNESIEQATIVLENMCDVQPWYIRTMVGFGAWLASLLLIGFVASIGMTTDSSFALIGAILIGGALFARRESNSDFMVQCSLACSLAGQALFAYGIVKLIGSDEFEGILAVVVILNVVLFFIFPDRIHRVLSVLIASTSVGVLLYIWELNAVVPVVGPVYAAAMVYCYKRQGAFIAAGRGDLIRPLISGLMLSAFGCLLLSTIYVLPELGGEFLFYPRPWISTILLGALFLYVAVGVWPQFGSAAGTNAAPIFFGLLVIVVAAAWVVPGLLLALIVVILGASSGNRVFTGAGIAFLTLFVATYFYGIQITMLTKSITLVATGTAVLAARWVLLRILSTSNAGDATRA